MSGTRSAFRTAPATDARRALIVAHGSPSAPEGPEQAIGALAARVQGLLPGWSVAGATLAGRGTLKAALHAVPGAVVVYPLFMSDGWFVSTMLPRRIEGAGADAARLTIAPPLGLDPALHALCVVSARQLADRHGLAPARTTLVLAAHGSPSDPRPKRAAADAVHHIAAQGGFARVCAGFVDEAPFLATAARVDGPALCLPFFAMRAGHVETDIPEALEQAGFAGPVAGPIGAHDGVPRIIADGLMRAALARAA